MSRMVSVHLLQITALATGLIWVSPSASYAQSDSNDNEILELDEIVVTALRREQNLQDAPVAVTAFSQADIQRNQIVQTIDIGQAVPGLITRNNTGQASAGQFHIRGAGQGDSLPSLEPGVGTYVDDVYVARTSSFDRALNDLQRIEVLRGPQGTLYGRNAVGGAIKIYTNRPDPDEQETRVSAGYGNFERYEILGSHNQPLGDRAALRISGGGRFQDEGPTNAPNLGRTVNTEDSWGFRAALLVKPSEDWEFILRGDYSEEDADCCYGSNLGDTLFVDANGELATDGNFDPRDIYTYTGFVESLNTTRDGGGSASITYFADNFDVKSITAYRESDVDLTLDFSGDGLVLVQNINSRQFSQELQLQGEAFEGRLEWLLGLFYFTEDNATFTNLGLPAIGFGLGAQLIDNGADAYAAFSNFNYKLTDRFRVSVGLRYTIEDKYISSSGFAGFEATGTPVFTDETLLNNGIPLNVTFRNFDPKFGLEFDIKDDVLAYASFTQGFKSGGWSARVFADANTFSALNEEGIDAYEIGVKAALFDKTVRLNVSGFWNEFSDLVVNRLATLPNGGTGTIAANAASARARGLEIETEVILSEYIKAFGSLSYTDSGVTAIEGDTGNVTVGDPLQITPEIQWHAGLDSDFPVDELGGNISARAVLSFRGSHFNGAAAEPVNLIESVTLLDLVSRYTHDSESWYVQAYCRNCTDEAYINARFSLGIGPAYVGLPRTYGLEVGFRF